MNPPRTGLRVAGPVLRRLAEQADDHADGHRLQPDALDLAVRDDSRVAVYDVLVLLAR